MTSTSEAGGAVDGRRARGRRTRRAIVGCAAAIASREGLEGVSIGRLSDELSLSKAGIFTHFGSKEELQLATIDHACEVFFEHVVAPSLQAPAGLARLQSLCRHWIEYARRCVFPGGCFFFSVTAEFDSRPGRVRDTVADTRRAWLDLLATCVTEAQERGEFGSTIDARQLAFELDAMGMAANLDAQLFGGSEAYDHAAAFHERRLMSLMETG